MNCISVNVLRQCSITVCRDHFHNPLHILQASLSALFQQYSGLREVRMVPGKAGLAFIEFGDEMQAIMALQSTYALLPISSSMCPWHHDIIASICSHTPLRVQTVSSHCL